MSKSKMVNEFLVLKSGTQEGQSHVLYSESQLPKPYSSRPSVHTLAHLFFNCGNNSFQIQNQSNQIQINQNSNKAK
jgi:hypothetical protein